MTAQRDRLARSPKVTVNVTQAAIDNGVKRSSSHCIVAEAVKRAVPNATHVSVDLATIRFTDPLAGRRYIYLTPRRAQEALVDFDQGEVPKPFRMTLEAAHVLLTGQARKARATLESHSRQGPKTIPTRVGGKPPPLGALHSGNVGGGKARKRKNVTVPASDAQRQAAADTGKIGRRREFGLRALIR